MKAWFNKDGMASTVPHPRPKGHDDYYEDVREERNTRRGRRKKNHMRRKRGFLAKLFSWHCEEVDDV